MELKDALKAIGLPEDIDSPEKLVEAHRSSYLLKGEAHEDEAVVAKVSGKIFGELTTVAKREFGLESSEIKDKPLRDIIKLGVEKKNTLIQSLEETASKGSEEVINKLKSDTEKYKGEAKQYKGDLEKLLGEKAELENTFNSKLKQFKVENHYKDVFAKLPLSESATEVAKLGFNTLIQSNYKLDVGDDDSIMVLDSKGQKIPNPKQTGTYLGLAEVLEMEAEKNGLLKKNNLPGGRVIVKTGAVNTDTTPAKRREIHPAAARSRA